MTVDEVKKSINKLKSQGWDEEEILGAFYAMFQDNKINLEELQALVDVLGYQLTDEFLNMSPEDQKTKWYEEVDIEDNIISSTIDCEKVIHDLERDGYNDEEIVLMVGMMYVDGKIDKRVLNALFYQVGYQMPAEMANLSEKKLKKAIQSQYRDYMKRRE